MTRTSVRTGIAMSNSDGWQWMAIGVLVCWSIVQYFWMRKASGLFFNLIAQLEKLRWGPTKENEHADSGANQKQRGSGQRTF